MKKFAVVLAVALCLGACGEKKEAPAESEKPVIKIGATLPLSGDAAEAGNSAKAALEMTLENLKAQGLKYDYQIVYEDNQMSAQKAATTVNKLIFADKVEAVFSMWNLMSNVASAIAAQNDIFSFSCAYGRGSTKGDYSFNLHNTFESQAELLLTELNKRNIKKLALFIDNSAMSEQFAVVEKHLKGNSDIQIVFKEYFNPGEKDYRTAIAKAASTDPDLYIISGYPPSPYIFLKQMKEITGRNDNVSAIDALMEISSQNRSVADGLWYIESNQNGLADFQAELLKKKGIEAQSCVGNTAANLEIFIKAVENAEKTKDEKIPSKENIRKWIFDNVRQFPTVSGSATVLDDGFLAVPPVVRMIKNGKSVEVAE